MRKYLKQNQVLVKKNLCYYLEINKYFFYLNCIVKILNILDINKKLKPDIFSNGFFLLL